MAQLSTNTVFYDQMIKRIQSFISKYKNNDMASYDEMAKEFESIVSDTNKFSLEPISKYNQVTKGEPPSSKKFNEFIKNVADDLNIIAKQLDYQSAQLVSLYNLFNSEIEKENQFANRIKSKVRILQAYSEAPAEDLYYFGDSFDNMDYVDLEKTPKNTIALVKDGSASLPVSSTSTWDIRSVAIIGDYSNGFIGNNHQVYFTDNVNSNYRYSFEDNNSVGLIQNITDGNPITYFEYEGIYVDPVEKRKNNAKDFEFLYSQETIVDGSKKIVYKDWSSKKTNEPLKLGISIKSEKAKKTNSVLIVPYFGSPNNPYGELKVSSITAVLEPSKKIVELLPQPIYIGSSFVPKSLESSQSFFYNKARVQFNEIFTSEINIYFEQNSSSDIKIQHLYWKPFGNSVNFSALDTQSRFDPSSLASLGFQNVQYDLSELVPPITRPNSYKDESSFNTKRVSVSYTDNLNADRYIVSFKRINADVSPSVSKYYYTNFPIGFESLLVQQQKSATTDINLAFGFESKVAAEIAKQYIESKISSTEWSSLNYQEISIELVKEKLNPKTVTAQISLKKNYEIYQAKKYTIALRSVEVSHDSFVQKAEIVSKPFVFGFNVKNLTISSATSFSSSLSNSNESYIKYYVSLDDAKNWIPISPIENPFVGINEILSFNENVLKLAEVKGVGYFNYPEIPKDTTKIRVKIEIQKPRYENVTPIIYSYQIAGRVEQS